MKILVPVVLALAALPAFAEKSCTVQIFGAGVQGGERTAIAEILDRPEVYLGRAVAIEGKVSGVCERMGCWMEVRADDGERSLRVKVKDGEIVFPMAALDHRAVAEGIVEKIEMSREQYIAYREHEAVETGRAFDRAQVGSQETFQVLRLRGTGAEICF